MSRKTQSPRCVVPRDAIDEDLHRVYGDDAYEIIAFRRFLALPENEKGQKLCPPHWYDYAMGKLNGRQAVEADG